jgi:hypothetical protein
VRQTLHDYTYGKTEKINGGINYIFSARETKPVLQTKGLFGIALVLTPFFRGKACQNLPFSAKIMAESGRKSGFFGK